MNKRLLILSSILGAMLCAHSFILSARGGHGHHGHHGRHRGDSFLPAAGGAFVGSMAATAVMQPRETVVVTPTPVTTDAAYLQAQINQQNYKIASMELKINSQEARIAALERKVK